MKTKKLAFVLVAVALSVSAYATKIPKMNIVAVDDSKALVTAVTDPGGASEFSIVSENGDIVYYKRSKAAAVFRSVFDFSALSDGKYTVKIETGTAQVKSEIEVDGGDVQVKAVEKELAPYFAYDSQLLKVSYLNFDRENISMLIYNNGELVFRSNLGNDFTIQRAFDVSKMVNGNFDFVLARTDEPYSFNVTR
ncbi:hypothetical protein [Maribellus sp. YY47]|uniref:hypothetical protein n=1 Tax=Maribellus sp. YY47 TaxID=2929486 RepID=UPI002001B970|nr:hypothetical protein [Maribellus sp. YY47]MCK3685313.1 hypothetical protein [Maribellus sp. YY47]